MVGRFKQDRVDQYIEVGPTGRDTWDASAADRLPLGLILGRVAKVLETVVARSLFHDVYIKHGFNNVNKVGFDQQSAMWCRVRTLRDFAERLQEMSDRLGR